jgi:hypothetical protein
MDLKWWKRVEYKPAPDAEAITMEIRRLKRAEAKEFQAQFAPMAKAQFKAYTAEKNATILEKLDLMNEVTDAIDEAALMTLFEKSVRNVGGLYIDGQAITAGKDLLEVADNALVFFVVRSIQELIGLAPQEGKASASPSTSSAGAGQAGASSSGATSTGNGNGTTPSTATESPEAEPSGVLVQ